MDEMEKADNSQLELFSQLKGAGDSSSSSLNRPFFSFLWRYEKTILMIIGLFITGIISFSLGVEKGKKLSTLKSGSLLDIAVTTNKASPVALQKQEVNPGKVKNPVPVQEASPLEAAPLAKSRYTIQLASYRTRTYAQKEAEILRRRGLLPLVFSSGTYTVLCVGRFPDKETAFSLLSELKKKYQGCYIRRL